MKRILVTGGAGFIGSHVVDKLIDAGYEPRILDLQRSPYHPDVETVQGDMLDVEVVKRAAHACDVIVHLAAAADVGEVQKNPVHSEAMNARGTVNVLEAARECEVGRVVYASTIWVYSDVDAEHVDEDTPLEPPAHLYTATKLAGELYCRSYRELYDVESTILRFGIPYGPRARPAAVLPIFVSKALAGEPLTLAGGGLQTRRFVYVEDLAEGVVRGLAPAAADRTYNLVSGTDVTIREMADTVGEIVGDVEVIVTEGRAGDFKGAEVSGERAAAELGWRPRTEFATGVRRYVDWHREQALAPAPTPVAPVPVAAASGPSILQRWFGALTWRRAGVALVGILAGALAAGLSSVDAFSDPAALAGSLVLLAIPTGLIVRIDWTRDRHDATLVLTAMLCAMGLVLFAKAPIEGIVEQARLHPFMVTLVALVGLALVTGVSRLRAARA